MHAVTSSEPLMPHSPTTVMKNDRERGAEPSNENHDAWTAKGHEKTEEKRKGKKTRACIDDA